MVLRGFEDPVTLKLLSSLLTYNDNRVDFELKKFKNRRAYGWFIAKYGEEAYDEKLAELKASKIKCLLKEEEDGTYTTHTGLVSYLQDKFPEVVVKNAVVYPEHERIAWDHVPTKTLRPYQTGALEALLSVQHGAISLPTGSGKSVTLLNLIKQVALKGLVIAPSFSIADQLYKEAVHLFGKKKVGQFFDGKKESSKFLTIAINKSLINVKPGDEHYENIRACKLMMVDESHLLAADTLAELCLGLLDCIPYRYFVSGTQLRNDGLDLLLNSIIGPIVYEKTLQELVATGYLAKPDFKMIQLQSSGRHVDDPNVFTREFLYYNNKVNLIAGQLANLCVNQGKPVLILVDEVEQFSHILPHLTHQAAFAHGPLTAANKKHVPKDYWESDVNKLVKRFNDLEFPILCATSCVTTGTDFTAPKVIIFLRGGKSEIDLRQSVGRGTRKTPIKDSFEVYDFDVIVNSDEGSPTHRHARAREIIYRAIYPAFKTIILK